MTNYKKDEIYIDCQPVNSEGETLVEMNKETENDTLDVTYDYQKALNNPFIAFIIGAIIIYILLKIFTVSITKLNKIMIKLNTTSSLGSSSSS